MSKKTSKKTNPKVVVLKTTKLTDENYKDVLEGINKNTNDINNIFERMKVECDAVSYYTTHSLLDKRTLSKDIHINQLIHEDFFRIVKKNCQVDFGCIEELGVVVVSYWWSRDETSMPNKETRMAKTLKNIGL